MTYTIPPESPKAVKARAFGDEMIRACRARDVTLNELARAVGVGHTALDHYRSGAILPKTATAREIARVLAWPKLDRIITEARTFVCERHGCTRTYVHEGGGPRRYCTTTCVQLAATQRMASRRLRQSAQTDDPRKRNAAIARLRSAVRIADERTAVLEVAIAAMCAGCEPEGLCRDVACALRPVSPLPLQVREGTGEARTETLLRSQRRWTPAHKEAWAESQRRRWARPGAREEQAERTRAFHASLTPLERQAWHQRVQDGKTRQSSYDRSAAARKAWATRRRNAESAA